MKENVKNLLKMCGFKESIDRVEHGFCPICGDPIATNEFTNEKSRKEYDISGMCQRCQNNIFKQATVDEDDYRTIEDDKIISLDEDDDDMFGHNYNDMY